MKRLASDGTVVLDETRCAYVVKGVCVPRVSAVLNVMYPWKDLPGVTRTQAQSAMDAGTAMHDSIERYLCGDLTLDGVTGDGGNFRRYLTAVEAWDCVGCEVVIGSATLKLGGKIDALFYDYSAETYVLVDWKRSKRLYPESAERYRAQTSLYRHILATEYGICVGQTKIVLLHPDLHRPHEIDIGVMDGAELERALGIADGIATQLAE